MSRTDTERILILLPLLKRSTVRFYTNIQISFFLPRRVKKNDDRTSKVRDPENVSAFRFLKEIVPLRDKLRVPRLLSTLRTNRILAILHTCNFLYQTSSIRIVTQQTLFCVIFLFFSGDVTNKLQRQGGDIFFAIFTYY